MRDFEDIIGREFMTSNAENNDYSYQNGYGNNKGFSRKKIAEILEKSPDDKLRMSVDRRFYSNGVVVLVEKKQNVNNLQDSIPQLEAYIKLEKALGTKKIVGILYDIETEIYICHTHPNSANSLQNMAYYESLFEIEVKREDVYSYIQKINERLNKLGMDDLVDRMQFTGLALVGVRIANEQKREIPTTSFSALKHEIYIIIKREIPTSSPHKDAKLYLLAETFNNITLNESSAEDVLDIYQNINKISEWVNSYSWDGKDAMAIFFHEFRRYAPKKSSHGQVFTPEIWTDLMYNLIDCNYTSKVLDAACGSGTFLTKAMSRMIKENRQDEQEIIKKVFGIEWARKIYVLACVNMLMHKDGRTNLIQANSTLVDIGKWISEQKITKVLMNPPFENSTGIKIVKNVLDNVEKNSLCAFILPDRTLYTKTQKIVNSILAKHTLEKIIKMPDKVFDKGVTTSIFIFRTNTPHNSKMIVKYHIKEDELVTVKNGGRQDVNRRWEYVENADVNNMQENDTGYLLAYWTDIIKNTRPHPTKHVTQELEYFVPKEKSVLTEEDFQKVVLDRILFENPNIKEKITNIKEKITDIKEKDWILWAIRSGDKKDGE